MTVLRDKIADVFECHKGEWTCYVLADSIIAALPDMVAPPVWEEHPSKAFWRCDAGFGIYKVYGMGGKPSWDFDGLTVQVSLMAESVEAAKSAANAHHAAAVVAALTGARDAHTASKED